VGDEEVSRRTAIHLIPDWITRGPRRKARFDAVVKVAAGAVVEDAAAIAIRLFDDQGRLVATQDGMHAESPRMQGPAWQRVRGRWMDVANATQAEAEFAGATTSPGVHSHEMQETVSLAAIPAVVGVAGEPHLWWRFHNRTDAPVTASDVLHDQKVWIDGQAYSLPLESYDGPAFLQPGYAFTGLRSLDGVYPGVRLGRHRVSVEMLGHRSPDLDVEWQILG
jgi:hypothetical protein